MIRLISLVLWAAIAITVIRGVLAPFGHVIWTAAASAALWKAMAGRRFGLPVLKDPRLFKVFLAVMALHMLWNSPVTLFPVLMVDAKYVVLGWVGWSIVLGLAREGYSEIYGRHNERCPSLSRLGRY
jgi:RsiW-degrading membrane proteinase PrsW (M82 family)